MLHSLVDLCESATPLDEKIDMLRWVFTDPSLDEQPFSFASCVRVAALSPHSPIPYCGVTDPDDVRDWLRQRAPV